MKDLFSVTGKTVLITGGSRGIGEMMAAGFLAGGAKVYISSRKAEACHAAAARLVAANGGECAALPADLSTLEGVTALATAFTARESRLDVLINNAGASWGAKLGEFPEAGWDKVMDTNVKGPFFLTQALLPALRAAAATGTPSRVINIGSVDGRGTPMFDTFSYGPSKAAIHHLTKMLAARLVRERILVNAIAPGPFPTWMLSTGVGFGGKIEGDGVDWEKVGKFNPSGRVGTPEDIAGLALFLASRAGEYIVGEVIACDGGLLAAR
jgi:NAD(P)-dependent dehydrogenase (short-subunit alcohol dehydrogenase family)